MTTTDSTAREKADLRPALIGTAVAGALAAIAAGAGVGAGAGLSTALGAAIGLFNLWALGRIVVALTTPSEEDVAAAEGRNPAEEPRAKKGSGLAWGLLGLFKFVALGGLLWLTLKHGVAHPLFLGLGFAALPLGITLANVLPKAKL